MSTSLISPENIVNVIKEARGFGSSLENMVKITAERAVLGIITGKGLGKILRGTFTAMVNYGSSVRESPELRILHRDV